MSKVPVFTAALKAAGKSFVDLIYPPFCLHCNESLRSTSPLFCDLCLELFVPIDSTQRCPYCFSADFSSESGPCCALCRKTPPHWDRLAAVFEYEGPASSLVKRMKYGGQFYLAKGIGAYLAAYLIGLEWPLPDYIIPMPMASFKKLERGYNQSKLLADVVGELLNRPVKDVLTRLNGDFSQAALSVKDRMQLNSEAFSLKNDTDLYDKNILLIDDVVTTGSTLKCCCEVLRGSCPAHIYALSFCKA